MSRRTVKDFPQEYFSIWQLAIKGQLRLVFPSRGFATNKKMDLQIFRKRLADEDPVLANEFFQVDLQVQGDENMGVLIGYIPDWKQQVREQLKASDLSTEAIAEIAKDTITTQEDATKDSMGEVIADLGFKSPNT